jgi:hypothetical protein
MNGFLEFTNQVSPVRVEDISYDGVFQLDEEILTLCNSDATIDGVRLRDLALQKGLVSEFMDDHGKTVLEYNPRLGAERAYQDIVSAIFLSKMRHLSEAQKAEAVESLSYSFHQKGLMAPVSGTLQRDFASKVEFDPQPQIALHFETTESGFKVQEIYRSKTMATRTADADATRLRMVTNEGGQPVVTAQATIDVKFDKRMYLKLAVESNTIEYGHELVRKHLQGRNPTSKLNTTSRFFPKMGRKATAAKTVMVRDLGQPDTHRMQIEHDVKASEPVKHPSYISKMRAMFHKSSKPKASSDIAELSAVVNETHKSSASQAFYTLPDASLSTVQTSLIPIAWEVAAYNKEDDELYDLALNAKQTYVQYLLELTDDNPNQITINTAHIAMKNSIDALQQHLDKKYDPEIYEPKVEQSALFKF